MSAWAVRDRNDTWDAVCDRAWAGEPQFVTRGGTQTVVVISIQSYEPERSRVQHRILKRGNHQSARDLLGYGAQFHKLRTTEEWMHELREGESV